MAKEKELSSNDKRRRTTLRKKSVDELVNIVLRKDDVERKLQKSIETFKNLQDVNDKRINNLKDSLVSFGYETTLVYDEGSPMIYCDGEIAFKVIGASIS